VPSGPFDTYTEARRFAAELSDLLNATVCRGVRLNAVVAPNRIVFVGYRIDKHNFVSQQAFQIGRKLYLGLSYQLDVDSTGKFLAVSTSFVGLFCDEDMDRELFHSDYERDKRDKAHGYPEAHLQVEASSADWCEVLSACQEPSDRDRSLSHLHLPVGGRRFRPTLEDMLEFVIVERLVDGHDGWIEAIANSRAGFDETQLRAAVRRNPEIARDALQNL
jgi:predicted transport protein